MTATARLCPICRKPEQAAYRPFCSRRCADVDLQRWFAGRYAVPAVEAEEGETPPEDPSDRGA
jgi:endogenous inhibitor of DNA gyrase (YacG/DUF329 family)